MPLGLVFRLRGGGIRFRRPGSSLHGGFGPRGAYVGGRLGTLARGVFDGIPQELALYGTFGTGGLRLSARVRGGRTSIPQFLQEQMTRAARQRARTLQRQLRQDAPRRTNRLARSIRVRYGWTGGAITISTRMVYYGWIQNNNSTIHAGRNGGWADVAFARAGLAGNIRSPGQARIQIVPRFA